MSDSRKFKIGGVEKSLKELWQEKKTSVASLATNDGKWNDISSTLATASDDDYKNYKFKINKKGEMEPVLNETTDITADDIVFSSSKSNLRRIADLERNVSILANRIATTDGNIIDTASLDSEDDREWDNYITEDTFFTKDVNLGNYSDDKIKVYGQLYINNGVTFGTTAQNAIKDTVSAMISNNTESGIAVTYDNVTHTLDFAVATAPKWATARTITLGGDLSGSVSIDGSANVTLTATVANDSHTHAFGNLTGKPTTLAGYGITDAVSSTGNAATASKLATARTISLTGDASGSVSFDGSANAAITVVVANDSHTHAFANITGKPTTLAGYGITDSLYTSGQVDSAISTAISNLVNGASAAYDTLAEIQNAMATDAELSAAIAAITTVANANKWTTARTISLAGDATGSVSIDGSANATLTVAVADDSHNHIIGNVDGLQAALDGKSATTHNHTLDSLSNVTITSNTNGEILKWNGTAWVNNTLAEAGIQAAGSYAAASHTHAFADLTGKPTTLAGYGITDAAPDTAFVGVTVSNDTLTFTRDNGTTIAVTTSDANTNTYLTGLAFNTADGVLTATTGSGTVTVDLDGRFTDNAYADTMNQHVRTTDSPTFAAVTATNFNGTATYAKYADLAERYAADAPYEEGTLLAFGGEAEVTAAQGYASTKIAGVVSVKPAVAMNAEAGNSQTHPFVALQGRVPVKVVGTVRKGDILVASDISGVATVWKSEDTDPRMTAYVGIAIENKSEGGVGFVEVKVGK